MSTSTPSEQQAAETAPAAGNGRVQLAYLHEEAVSHSWHDSLRRLIDHDRAHDARLTDKPLNIRCNTGRLVQSRNFATKLFLDNTDAEWLWWCDTDMGFEPDALDRLLQAAHPVDAPVIGALCFALMESGFDGMGGMRFQIVPTMYMIGNTADGHASFCFYGPYPDDTVAQVAGTGGAFLLLHRSVLEKIRAEHGDHWFSQVADDRGDVIGEDLSLCLRLGALGVPMFVHTGVKTTHHKQLWIGEQDYLMRPLQRMEETPGGAAADELPIQVHLAASLASLGRQKHVRPDGMLKLDADLDRYRAIINATRPEVIVETGTHTGASARWFAEQGLDVITIDIDPATGSGSPTAASEFTVTEATEGAGTVSWIKADAADPATAAGVAAVVAGRRCMVTLDSDHSAAHVAREIDLYGPLVTAGCYLVVEDTIFGYAPQQLRDMHIPGQQGTPLDAVAEKLADNPDWSRDVAIERASPVSHHPAGFWLRNAPVFSTSTAGVVTA